MTDDAFQPLQQALAAAGSPLPPTEAHGLLCGLLCAGITGAEGRWLAEVAPEAPAEEVAETLTALPRRIAARLADPELGFAPLLPDEEETTLSERAQGLVDWCQGFLYGFGLGGPSRGPALPRQSQEALRDIAELTRLDVAALEDGGEQEERELADLAEFLRVAVLLVREERLGTIQQRAASHNA